MKNVVLIALLVIAASANALDFKGIELGKSRADDAKVKEAFDGAHLACMPDGKQTQCWGNASIAGEFGNVSLYADSDKIIHLLIVSFDARGYDAVSKALASKFGSTVKTKPSTLSNQMGAKVSSVTKEWTLDRCSVELERYFGKRDKSAVIYQCPTAAHERDVKSARQKNDKDL